MDSSDQVLIVTVSHMLFSVTEEVLHQVFSPYGIVEKISMYQESDHLQALIHFRSRLSAISARISLQDRNIYDGCCKLNIQILKATKENNVNKVEIKPSMEEILRNLRAKMVEIDRKSRGKMPETVCLSKKEHHKLQSPTPESNNDETSDKDKIAAKVFDKMLPEVDEVKNSSSKNHSVDFGGIDNGDVGISEMSTISVPDANCRIDTLGIGTTTKVNSQNSLSTPPSTVATNCQSSPPVITIISETLLKHNGISFTFDKYPRSSLDFLPTSILDQVSQSDSGELMEFPQPTKPLKPPPKPPPKPPDLILTIIPDQFVFLCMDTVKARKLFLKLLRRIEPAIQQQCELLFGVYLTTIERDIIGGMNLQLLAGWCLTFTQVMGIMEILL